MGLTEFISHYATTLISATGYLGVCLLMTLESMVFPVPSEAVMPFAGFLVITKRFSLWGVILASTLGSIIGSLFSYAMGRYGGEPFIQRFGKYFLLDLDELRTTERFFQRYGQITILLCRFIPVVRHLISLPAGMGRMPLPSFCLFTLLGAGVWNTFLAWCGMLLRQHWDTVMRYSHQVDLVVVVLLAAALGWYIWRHLRRRRST